MSLRPFQFADKGPGLVEAIEAAGIKVVQHSQHGWLCSDPQAAEAIVASFDPVPRIKAQLVDLVKAEAQARILAIVPLWKQNNLLAQATILAKKGEANWTPQEQAAWEAGEELWNRVAAIRAASDQIEVDIAELADWRDLIEFDVQGSSRWPE